MDDDPNVKTRTAWLALALVVGLLVFGALLAAGLDVILDGVIAWLIAIIVGAGLWIRYERKQQD